MRRRYFVTNYIHKLLFSFLRRNSFTGRIPTGMGRLVRLEWLAIHSNGFEGNLPGEIFNSSYIKKIGEIQILMNSLYLRLAFPISAITGRNEIEHFYLTFYVILIKKLRCQHQFVSRTFAR